MRRITLLFATLVAIVGLGAPAAAQNDVYPPRFLIVTVSDGSPEPAAPFDVTVTGCAADEVIDFEFGDQTASVPCVFPNAITGSAGDSGAATQRFVAPSEGGTFAGSVSFASTDATIGVFQIDVPSVVLASVATNAPLVHNTSWTPDFFTLVLIALLGIAVTAVVRMRLLNA